MKKILIILFVCFGLSSKSQNETAAYYETALKNIKDSITLLGSTKNDSQKKIVISLFDRQSVIGYKYFEFNQKQMHLRTSEDKKDKKTNSSKSVNKSKPH